MLIIYICVLLENLQVEENSRGDEVGGNDAVRLEEGNLQVNA